MKKAKGKQGGGNANNAGRQLQTSTRLPVWPSDPADQGRGRMRLLLLVSRLEHQQDKKLSIPNLLSLWDSENFNHSFPNLFPVSF